MCHHSPECISLIHMNINHAEWQIKGQASHPDILYIEIGEFLFVPQKTKSYFDYRTRAIITRGLYIFYPIFSAVYNQERLILQTI